MDPKAKIGLWGYSGGAFAVNWALEIQESYAPELKFVGAATGGTINNISNALTSINKGAFTVLIPTAFLGLSVAYPDFGAALQKELIPATKAKFNSLLTQCTSSAFAGQDITTYFRSGPAFLNQSVVLDTFAKVNIGKRVPKTPLYVYKAVHDEISAVGDTDAVVDFYCRGGAAVEYKRDEASGHVTLAITGAGEAMAWLEGRLDGMPAKAGCETQTVVSTLLDPVGLLALGGIVAGALAGLLEGIVNAGLGGS